MWAALLALPASLVLSHFTEPQSFLLSSCLMNFVQNGRFLEHEIDSLGIPSVQYKKLGGKTFHNPVYVAMYGLFYYDRYKGIRENAYFTDYYKIFASRRLDPETYKKRFLNTARWLKDNLQIQQTDTLVYGVYLYPFPWPVYRLKAGWKSAMAQGVAAQIFLRAWRETGDSAYIQKAELALKALLVPVEKGGVTLQDSENSWWYEEYADTFAVRSRVLNGMEHVLIALDEMFQATQDTFYKILFDKGMNALAENITKFSHPRMPWTWYDLDGHVANYKYHHVNINLTQKLYEMTQKDELKIFEKWKKMHAFYFIREFLKQKPDLVDIGILLINFCFSWGALILILSATRWFKV
ncbi:MAG: D-glucuronyl C5-epimerase family protein [Flavobacteriales bacterium]|nr:D-glucuronyl C5-epimerase family protein [Flavobacteriales bacterium]MDW8431292.1 D-glucuronyl C5-epimerase family protein [Flavobacteriales bacterium]